MGSELKAYCTRIPMMRVLPNPLCFLVHTTNQSHSSFHIACSRLDNVDISMIGCPLKYIDQTFGQIWSIIANPGSMPEKNSELGGIMPLKPR
jgi:hypothetical protein